MLLSITMHWNLCVKLSNGIRLLFIKNKTLFLLCVIHMILLWYNVFLQTTLFFEKDDRKR